MSMLSIASLFTTAGNVYIDLLYEGTLAELEKDRKYNEYIYFRSKDPDTDDMALVSMREQCIESIYIIDESLTEQDKDTENPSIYKFMPNQGLFSMTPEEVKDAIADDQDKDICANKMPQDDYILDVPTEFYEGFDEADKEDKLDIIAVLCKACIEETFKDVLCEVVGQDKALDIMNNDVNVETIIDNLTAINVKTVLKTFDVDSDDSRAIINGAASVSTVLIDFIKKNITSEDDLNILSNGDKFTDKFTSYLYGKKKEQYKE